MPCVICGAVALRVVAKQGYCRLHRADADKALLAEQSKCAIYCHANWEGDRPPGVNARKRAGRLYKAGSWGNRRTTC